MYLSSGVRDRVKGFFEKPHYDEGCIYHLFIFRVDLCIDKVDFNN